MSTDFKLKEIKTPDAKTFKNFFDEKSFDRDDLAKKSTTDNCVSISYLKKN